VEKCLKAVKLWANGVADKPSGSYSGGMKRRLSVAISLMGSPKVVYLDEPSTVRELGHFVLCWGSGFAVDVFMGLCRTKVQQPGW
jgi:ABC-type cobalamin/Fe3+-siderophores transport system ATPase subunit